MPDKMNLSGIGTMAKLMWAAFLHPRFLGGTRRKYVLYGLDVKRERLEAVAALLAEGVGLDALFSTADISWTLQARCVLS
jgi:hypothetical protein